MCNYGYIPLSHNDLTLDTFQRAMDFYAEDSFVVERFEKLIEQFTNRKSLAVNTGTAAIHLALLALGVSKDDEVICPTFTFVASANPILYQRANPVFVDSEPDTWNMCPKVLRRCIQDRLSQSGKLPKAIIVVHIYGTPAKLNEIREVANDYNIPLLEDAAEALGATYCGESVGSVGEFGVFSFNNNKIVTSFGGGILLARNHEHIERARYLASQAKGNKMFYQHNDIGYNYRMGAINATFGLESMNNLNVNKKIRGKIRENYIEHLGSLCNFQSCENDANSNSWLTTILLPSFRRREKIRLALKSYDIESRPLWKPMHLQPIFKDCPYYGDGLSEKLFEKGLCLPSGSNLTENQQAMIINIIKNCF